MVRVPFNADVSQVACFDTRFHAGLHQVVAVLAILKAGLIAFLKKTSKVTGDQRSTC